MEGEDDSYEVGFRRPPKKTRFARGQSGNPKGRPKGSKNVITLLLRVGRQRVKVKGERGSRSISKVEAAYTQLFNQAASGNLPAIRELVRLHHMYAEPAQNAAPKSMDQCDQVVMESIVRRVRQANDPVYSPELDTPASTGDAEK